MLFENDPSLAFASGSITQIELFDFMTHSYLNLRPGPRLNVIIGPNGAGKSSIVCAICLGLGGEPSNLGRASALNSFIKFGKDEAKIKITLKSKKNFTKVITRTLIKNKKKGNSEYFIDYNKVTKTEVREFLESFNIDVSSLTQILPQDKVGDFSKCDQVTLLKETVLATLGQEFLDLESKIFGSKQEKESLHKLVAEQEALLKQLTERKDGMAQRVKQLKRKQKLEEKIQGLKYLSLWYEVEERRKELMEQRSEVKSILVEKKEVLKKRDEMHDKTKGLVFELKNMKKESELKLNQLKSGIDKTNRKGEKVFKRFNKDYANLVNMIEESNGEKERLEKELETTSTKLKAAEQVLKKKEELFLTFEDAKIEECEEIMKESAMNIEKLTFEKQDLFKKEQVLRFKRDKLKGLKNKSADLQEKRLSLVADRMPGSVSLDRYKYILEKKERQGVSIEGPLFLDIGVDSKVCKNIRGIIERIIPQWLLCCYVVEDSNSSLMSMEGVSIVSVSSKASNNKAQTLSDIDPEGELGNLGILGFAHEFLKIESWKVKEVLLDNCGLKDILIANSSFKGDDRSMNLISKKLNRSNVVVMSEKETVEQRMSKYSGEISVSREGFLAKGRGQNGKFLVGALRKEESDVEGVDEQEVKEELTEVRMKLREVADEMNLCDVRSKKSKDYLELHKKTERNLISLRTQISLLEETKKGIELTLNEKDFDSTAEELSGKLIGGSRKIIPEIERIVENQLRGITELDALSISQSFLFNKKRDRLISGKRNRFWEKTSSLLDSNAKRISHKLKRNTKEFKGLEIQLSSQSQWEKAGLELKSQFDSAEKVSLQMDEFMSELASLSVDKDSMREYESLERQLFQCEKDLEKYRIEFNAAEATFDSDKKRFEDNVNIQVNGLRERFSNLFGILRSAGYPTQGTIDLVELEKGYGLSIKVKFRELQELHELDAMVHSGGERSLTTFIFLLALQGSKSRSFQVVDEINQGMDAQKERLSYSCLQKSIKDQQYFLITPKLLRGLKHDKSTCMILINAGEYAASEKEMMNSFHMKYLHEAWLRSLGSE